MSASLPFKTSSVSGSNQNLKAPSRKRYMPAGLQQALWKDYRAIAPMLLTIILCTIGLQLLLVSIWDYSNPVKAQELIPLTLFVMAIPFVVLLGCTGVLIGSERESHTWNWCSSLPIDWRISLLSKLTVTLVASLTAALLTSIIPAVLGQFGHLEDYCGANQFFTFIGNALLIWCQLLLLSFFCVLLFREAITALLIAAGSLFVCHLLFIFMIAETAKTLSEKWIGSGIDPDQMGFVAYISLSGLLLPAFALLMVVGYRWRWYSGQNAEVPSLGSLARSIPMLDRSDSKASLSIRDQTSRALLLSAPHPRIFRTELWLTFRGQWAINLAVIAVPIATALVVWGQPQFGIFWSSNLALVLSWLAIAILGSLTFAGDQSRGRYRFLADRGASPTVFWATRLLVSLLTVIAVIVIDSFVLDIQNVAAFSVDRQYSESSRFMGIAPAYFGVTVLTAIWMLGVLASICLRRPIMSALATVLILFGIMNLVVFVHSMWKEICLAPNDYPNLYFLLTSIFGFGMNGSNFTPRLGIHPLALCTFSVSLLVQWLIVLRPVVKRWLVWESPRLEIIFLLAIPVTLLISSMATAFVTATFGLLTSPS